MDTIAFTDTMDADIGVRIIINGRELIEIVRDIELPFATREGHADLAGAYSYFGPAITFLPSRHFLGEPVHSFADADGRIYLLSCACGVPACWPLLAHVELREGTVVWRDFRQPYRGPHVKAGEWRYDGFGPFVFERQSYEQALSPEP